MVEIQQNTPDQERPLPRRPFYYSTQFWLKAVIFIQAVLLGLEFSPELSTNGDDAVYYFLGKSLFSGNGYREIFSPQNGIHSQYPPLFPAFLGLAGSFSNTPLIPKIAVGIIAVGCVLLFVLLLNRMEKRTVVLPLALFTAVSWSLASHATLLMSEIPFLAATLGGFLLYESSRRHPESRLYFWLAIAGALLPVMIRTIGIAFAGAIFISMVFDKRYKQALTLLFAGIAMMLLLRLLSHESAPYIGQLLQKNSYNPEPGSVSIGDMVNRVQQNVGQYCLKILPLAMLGRDLSSPFAATVGCIITAFTVAGGIGNVLGRHRYIGIYSILYAAIISVWQTPWAGERFLIPLAPFLAFFLISGFTGCCAFVMKASAGRRKRSAPWLAWLVVGTLAFPNLASHGRHIMTSREQPPDWRNFYSCVDWIRLNTPANAVVVSRKPEIVYARSQRQGYTYPFSYDVEKVTEGIRREGATFCILDNFTWTKTSACYLFPAIQAHPEIFRVVYSLSSPDTYVLEIRPESR